MTQILIALAGLTSATISIASITISKNRQYAREEIAELNNTIDTLSLIKQGKIVYMADESTLELSKLVHQSNNLEQLEAWRQKKVTEKITWLNQPYYKQFSDPPISRFSELFSELKDN